MKKYIQRTLNNLSQSSELYRNTSYIVLSSSVGAFAGVGATLFRILLNMMRGLFDTDKPGTLLMRYEYLIVFMPVIGGIIIATMTRLFPAAAAERGVTSIIKSVLLRNGFIPLKVTAFHMAAPLIAIGTGAPLGPEGPSAKIGSGMGSLLCRILRLPPNDMKMFTAAGAGAAIAAVFNAPIAGVFFGIEVILLNKIKNRFLGCFIIAAVAANLVSHAVSPEGALFAIPNYKPPLLADYPIFILCGIACGMVSLAYYSVSRFAKYAIDDRLRIHNEYLKLLPLCLFFGFILLSYREIYGLGYTTINRIINGTIAYDRVAILLILKIAFVAFFLRCGSYGGIFAPALSMGAMTGYLVSSIVNKVFHTHVEPVLFTVAGMGGVLAGMNTIPLTAIMLVFEVTGDYRLILPLMIVSVISYLAIRYVHKENRYVLELLEDGVSVSTLADENILSNVDVKDIMRTNLPVVGRNTPLRAILSVMEDSPYGDCVVLDSQLRVEGVISLNTIKYLLASAEMPDFFIAIDVCEDVPLLSAGDTAFSALEKINEYDVDTLPVVSSLETREFIGVVTRHEIMKAYHCTLKSRDILKR